MFILKRGNPGLFLHTPSAVRPHRDLDADVCDDNKMPRPPSAYHRVRPRAGKKNKKIKINNLPTVDK